MVCWNPKDGVSVNCGIGAWSCKVISINEIQTILNISNGKFLNILNKQTDLKTGEGSCNAQPLTTTNEVYYCTGSFSLETMSNCNKLAGKKCWNPVAGTATTATCGNNDYQCKVKYQTLL